MRFVVPNALPVEIGRADLLYPHDQLVKVTVLSAPSGYGKTTALAQIARRTATPVWIRLNEEARDARVLLNDLTQGSRIAGVSLFRWGQLSLLDSSREQLLGALLEDLNDHDEDLTFCLDGGEHLSAESAMLLSSFAELLGEGHQLAIAQREGSAFNAAPFQARHEAVIITAQQLLFTPDHTTAVARQLGEAGASGHLQTTYQGWPWGIMLALHTHQTGTAVAATELARGVLSGLPPHLLTVLPALCVLEFWSGEGAANLGVALPDDWIEQLQRAGLPMSSVDNGRFVPHDVVRELLTELLRQQPGRWRAMHARAAELAEAQGELYSAIRHHVNAGQIPQAVHLAEQLAPRWYRAADWRLAEEALRLIPSAHLSAELRSLYALAVLESGHMDRGRALLEAQLATEPTATVHFGLSLIGLRTMDRPLMGRHIHAGLAMATQQRDIIQLLRTKAIYHQMQAEMDAALKAAEEAVERAEALGDASLRIAALSVKAYVLQREGQPDRAVQEFERTYQAGVQLGMLHRLMPVVDQLGGLYSYTGRTAEAAHMLENYLAACERSYPLATPVIQKTLGRTYYSLGRIGEGQALIWKAYAEFLQRGHFNQLIDALYSVYFAAILGQDRARAIDAFDRVRTLMGEDQEKLGDGPWSTLQEMHAYAAYSAGQLDQALTHLHHAAETAQRFAGRTSVMTEVLHSEIRRQRGQLTAADARALKMALELQLEDLRNLRTIPALITPLLQTFIAQEWETPYFQAITDQLQAPNATATTQAHLHLTTFGRVQATLNDQPIKLGHTSALEALVYRLLHPDARQDEVADQVWDHGDLKRARQSAQVARSAMNTAFRDATAQSAPMLGDLLVSAGQGRRNPPWVINPGMQVTTDVQAFLTSASPELMLSVHPQAFLPHSDREWVTHLRSVLTSHAVRVLNQAAQTADPRTALQYLVRAADLTQHPEGYEKVIHAAHTVGHLALSEAARQALLDLKRGEVTVLGEQWTVH